MAGAAGQLAAPSLLSAPPPLAEEVEPINEQPGALQAPTRKERRAARRAAAQARVQEISKQRSSYTIDFCGVSCGWKAPFARPRLAVGTGNVKNHEDALADEDAAPKRCLGLLGPAESTYRRTYKAASSESVRLPVKTIPRNASQVPLGSLYGESVREARAFMERERVKMEALSEAHRLEQETLHGTAMKYAKDNVASKPAFAHVGDPRAASLVLGCGLPSSAWTTESRSAWTADVHAKTVLEKYFVGVAKGPSGQEKHQTLLASTL